MVRIPDGRHQRCAPRSESTGYQRLHVLDEIADNPEVAARDRIAAIDLMLEHGMRGNISVDEVRAAVLQMLDVIREVVEIQRCRDLPS